MVVLNAGQTEDVLFGDNGVVPRLKDGAVIMSCATVPPEFAMDAEARCAAAGIHYLDAPISGGSIKAAEGRLSVMAAGRPEALPRPGRFSMPPPRPCLTWETMPARDQ